MDDQSIDGNFVNFSKQSVSAVDLEPQQSLTITVKSVGGDLGMVVRSLDYVEPERDRVVGSHVDPGHPLTGPGSVRHEFQYVEAKVDLFGPEPGVAAMTWLTPDGWSQEEAVTLDRRYDTGPFAQDPQAADPVVWNLVVTNTSSRRVRCLASVSFIHARLPLERRNVTNRLLSHAYQVVLEALTPRAELDGSVAVLEFGEELAAYVSATQGVPFGTHTIPLPSPVSAQGQLLSVDVALRSGQDLLDAVHARWKAKADALSGLGPIAQAAPLVQQQIAANDAFKRDWESKVRPDFVTLFSRAVATDVTVSAHIAWWDVDVADIASVSTEIYVAFEPDLTSGHTLILSPAQFTGGVAELAADLGIIPDAGECIEAFAPTIDGLTPQLGGYLAAVLLRIVAGGGRFLAARSDGLNVSVMVTADPELIVRLPVDGAVVHPPPLTGLQIAGGGADAGGAVSTPTGAAGSASHGVIPPEFIIDHPESLARLDQIDTIVVLMMENRSFDHMLGYLRPLRGEQYEGLHGNESNPAQGGVSGTVPCRPAAELLAPLNLAVTKIDKSPDHGFEHVKTQVNDGLMDGFVRDYALASAHPELAMSYYTDAELHAYYQIAANFCVADHWFAAHPGPTWPNRWATISGRTPELENFDVRDPKLGFLSNLTIFDVLRGQGIDFRYFEHNASILRMFGGYRTDDQFVAPFAGPDPGRPWEHWDDDFHAVAARGELPPLVFIDPNFSDIPPISAASDDLAPADLTRGQQLVVDIHNTLVASPQWSRMLFVITYDEHGGFFDHVPPPGTSRGPAAYIGNVPRIHPDGADHMGVRVPALIISPWVGAGSVADTVFDHTSIIKTVLVRHRERLSNDVFTLFGERVNQANHLGAALDQQHRRENVPAPIALGEHAAKHKPGPADTAMWDSSTRVRPTWPADGDRTDFSASLAGSMVPRTPAAKVKPHVGGSGLATAHKTHVNS